MRERERERERGGGKGRGEGRRRGGVVDRDVDSCFKKEVTPFILFHTHSE